MPDGIVDGSMREMSPSDFCLLVFYCRVANAKGVSYYAQETISKITGISVRQIGKSTHILKDMGYIALKTKGNRTREITISQYLVGALPKGKVIPPIVPSSAISATLEFLARQKVPL